MAVSENLAQPATGAIKKATQTTKAKKREIAVSPDLLEDSSHGEMTVRGWKKLKQDFQKDLLLFKITQEATLKMEWSTLPGNVREAFKEVLSTLNNKGEQPASETEGESFVFGFADDDVHITAVCAELNGKVAFFFKEV